MISGHFRTPERSNKRSKEEAVVVSGSKDFQRHESHDRCMICKKRRDFELFPTPDEIEHQKSSILLEKWDTSVSKIYRDSPPSWFALELDVWENLSIRHFCEYPTALVIAPVYN